MIVFLFYKTAEFADKAFIKVGGAVQTRRISLQPHTWHLRMLSCWVGAWNKKQLPKLMFFHWILVQIKNHHQKDYIDLKGDLSLNGVQRLQTWNLWSDLCALCPEFEPLQCDHRGEVVYPGNLFTVEGKHASYRFDWNGRAHQRGLHWRGQFIQTWMAILVMLVINLKRRWKIR